MKIKYGILLCITLLLSLSLCVSAAQPVDLDAHGSVTVTMTLDGEPVSGGTLTLYSVAQLYWNGNEYAFAFSSPFSEGDLPVEGLDTKETADIYAAYATEYHAQGTTEAIGDNGTVVFSQLPVGLYLIAQHQSSPGCTAASPFLVTVPTIIGEDTVYDVDASPKVSISLDLSEGENPDSPDKPGDEPSGDIDSPPEEPSDTPDSPSDGSEEPTDDRPDDFDEPDTPTDEPPTIPQTGQLKWPVPVLAVAGLLVFSFGWWMLFKAGRVSR